MSAASCFSLEPIFLRPNTSTNKLRFSIPRRNVIRKSGNYPVGIRIRVEASRKEEVIVIEKEDGKIDIGGNGNGSYVSNGKYVNGSVGENGSLMKYVNGNGNGGVKSVGEVVEKKTNKTKKKTIEEIGQEDAWFKQKTKGKVEVSVAPDGRWNRFKTYSTIQRTCEICRYLF